MNCEGRIHAQHPGGKSDPAIWPASTVALRRSIKAIRPKIAVLLKAGADARRKDASGRAALDHLNVANWGRTIVQSERPPIDDRAPTN